MIAVLLLLCGAVPELVSEAPPGAVKLLRPGTRTDTSQTASTSRAPWVDANGWRYRRTPEKLFVYDGVPAQRLPLAVAEAYAYGGKAAIRAADGASKAAEPMLAFVKALEDGALPNVADIVVIDDGSPMVGEILNLLSRRNLLYTTKRDNSKQAKLVVEVGTSDFPRSSAANPAEFTKLVRQRLGDAKRSLRIYGSETIVGTLSSDGARARLQLLNYGTDPVESFRVRTLGRWTVDRIRSFDDANPAVEELEYHDGGTEFSVPRVSVYSVIDFVRKQD